MFNTPFERSLTTVEELLFENTAEMVDKYARGGSTSSTAGASAEAEAGGGAEAAAEAGAATDTPEAPDADAEEAEPEPEPVSSTTPLKPPSTAFLRKASEFINSPPGKEARLKLLNVSDMLLPDADDESVLMAVKEKLELLLAKHMDWFGDLPTDPDPVRHFPLFRVFSCVSRELSLIFLIVWTGARHEDTNCRSDDGHGQDGTGKYTIHHSKIHHFKCKIHRF